jgi:RHS repeat-associated protein
MGRDANSSGGASGPAAAGSPAPFPSSTPAGAALPGNPSAPAFVTPAGVSPATAAASAPSPSGPPESTAGGGPTPTGAAATPEGPSPTEAAPPPPLRSGQAHIGFNHQNLNGWDITVQGGSEQGKGSVRPGSALLEEGDSFLVGLEQSFVVPANPAALVFTYTDLYFDTSDPDSMNDAFEASLVDAQGRPLVHPFTSDRDAFFNISEELGLATGPGVTETGGAIRTVTVDMAGVLPGTEATIKFRLVNNDQDTGTQVRILDVFVPSANRPPVVSGVGDQTASEGTPVAIHTTFTDPDGGDSHTATVEWGDGTTGPAAITPTAAGEYAVDATHVYADDGTYSARLAVTDSAGASGETAFSVSVDNVAPTVTAGVSFRQAAGSALPEVVLAGSLSDPGFTRSAAATAETFTATVDWGDGTTEPLPLAMTPGGEGQLTTGRFSTSHRYSQPGVYTARVAVDDDDQGEGVVDSRQGLARLNVTRTLNVPAGGSVPVLVLRDPGFDATQIDVNTVRFAPAGVGPANNVMQVRPTDVRFNFAVAQTGVHQGDTSAFLTGRLLDGTPFASVAPVAVVGGAALPTPSLPSSTKFFVADAAADRSFRYSSGGGTDGSFALDAVAKNARGVASNAAGDRVWVIDGVTQVVTVQGPDGTLLGYWRAEGLQSPAGITTDGADVWVVDAGSHEVVRYAGAAGLTSGMATPIARFGLDAANASPSDLVTDGKVVWVTDDAADAVFVYTVGGALLGRWNLDPANADASGVTRNPTGASSDLWVVDRVDRVVYTYAGGSTWRDGDHTVTDTFPLAAGDTQPEGIADPPPPGVATNPDYGQLPLSFEPNVGQTDSLVDFLSRGVGYTLFLTPGEAVLSLEQPAGATASPDAPAEAPVANTLRMQLVGSNPRAVATGSDELVAKSNYLTGNDPRQWHTDVPNYAGVRYHGVYDGVDLTYYGNQGQLEYDFVIAPQANPGSIAFRFAGADRPEIDPSGNLVLHTPGGDVMQHAPVIYQDGNGSRQVVTGSYTLRDDGTVGFTVGPYDATRPLVIDPVLSYSTYLGGSGSETARGVTVDASGNVYVVGATGSVNFPMVNPVQGSNRGGTDTFVVKLNAAGTALLYSTYLGGDGDDGASGVAVDATGNVYLAGDTISGNFPTTAGAFQPSFGGNLGGRVRAGDGFVAKLNPAGNSLIYATYLGGSFNDFANRIAVDDSGNASVTGTTASANFPTTPGAFQRTFGGDLDGFVAKVNPTGSALVYSTYLGGNQLEIVRGFAVDAAGNAYVSGSTASGNFPATAGAFQTSFAGGDNGVGGGAGEGDAFVTKLNPTGSALVYSTYLGGSANEQGTGLTVDAQGNAYAVGITRSTNFPTQNPFQATLRGSWDSFVTKLNAAGSALVYSTYLGGTTNDEILDVKVDAAGSAVLVGETNATDFPTVNPTQPSNRGDLDGFITKLSPPGSALIYSSYLGGSGTDEAYAVALDNAGNVYVVGNTSSANFPTARPLQGALSGSSDAFVSKFGIAPPAISVRSPSNGTAFPPGTSVLVSGNASAPVTLNGRPVDALDGAGNFFTRVTVAPGQNTFTFTATDSLGQTATTTLNLNGVQPPAGGIDFTNLAALAPNSFQAEYGRTSWQDAENLLHAELAVRNTGQYPAETPLLVGITNISDPTVRVHDPDGVTPDGIPYFDFSTLVADGVLSPTGASDPRGITFFDPNRVQFTYDLVFLGHLNQAPRVTSVPDVEALAGKAYTYPVTATDPDGDPLTFSLVTRPNGMTINPGTGVITWTPTAADLGTPDVRVRVEDGRGGSAEQHYALSVITPPPNRPPVFTSVPVVSANVGTAYAYPATASDPDGDPLTFSLVSGPSGMTVTPTTGAVNWTPTTAQLGPQSVTLQVDDGRGGTARQTFTVQVEGQPGNHPPVIVTDPVTTATPGQTYTYEVDAVDPDSDPLTYSLTTAPTGMTIDPASGQITWAVPSSTPALGFARTANATGTARGYGVVTDAGGNVYATGVFSGTVDLDPGAGTGILTSSGGENVYVAKYAPGGQLLWAQRMGKSNTSEILQSGIAIDASGAVYVTGGFSGSGDFGPFTLTSAGGIDIFVAKLDSAGNFVWARRMGGGGQDESFIAVDGAGNSYLTGRFRGTATFGSASLTSNGGYDVFVAKLDPAGNTLWAQGQGNGGEADIGVGVAADGAGGMYVTGRFAGTVDYGGGAGVLSSVGGSADGFLERLDATGRPLWVRRVGGTGSDAGDRIAVDGVGDAYVTGSFAGAVAVPLGTGTANLDAGANTYALYVAKVTAAGTFVWAGQLGGSSGASNAIAVESHIAVDCASHVYVTGTFTGTQDFDPGSGVFALTSKAGTQDMFLSELDGQGHYLWAGAVGGNGADLGYGIAVDNSGGVVATGVFQQTVDFDPGPGTANRTTTGTQDMFVVRLTQTPPCPAVAVRVDDGRGGSDTQSFMIDLSNHPPTITSQPVTAATSGLPYRYDVDATDPDNDPLTYSLTTAPTGMTIDGQTGLIQWAPTITVDPTLPSAPGFQVSRFANVDRAGSLAFAPDGTVFVANWSNAGPVFVHRVGPTGSPVENYGNQRIGDPDSVLYDATGRFSGTPGSVLVACGDPRGGIIYAIRPNGSVVTVFGPDPAYPNPDSMQLDPAGRLVFIGGNPGGVEKTFVSTGGTPTLLYDWNVVAYAGPDRIYSYTSDASSVRIQLRDATGAILNDHVAVLPVLPVDSQSGFQPGPALAVGPGGVWGTDLYVLYGPDLYRYDSAGDRTLIGTGLGNINSLAFGPDNALWVNAYNENRIIRIAPLTADVTVRVDDGRGGSDSQSYQIALGFSGELHGTAFNDLNGDGVFDQATLYWTSRANGGTLKAANLDGSAVRTVVSGRGLHGFAVDPSSGTIYEAEDGGMYRINPDGTGRAAVFPGFSGIGNVQLDAVHHAIYWSNGVGIWRGDLDTDAAVNIYQRPDGTVYVRGIAVDPAGGKLYFADFDATGGAFIGRMGLFGENPGVLIPLGNNPPQDLAIDYAARKIYWTDGQTDGVYRTNLDGTGPVETVIHEPFIDYPLAFDPGAGVVYFSGGTTPTINRVNPDGTGFTPLPITDSSNIDFMQVLNSTSALVPDPGLGGRTVYIDANGNGVRDAGEFSTTTAADGGYSFTGLAAGTYTVAQELPSGWGQTAPSGGRAQVVTVVSGQPTEGADFGSRLGIAAVGGSVFDDRNGDGHRQVEEPGLAGRTVYIDANGNVTRDPGERSAVTDQSGLWSFPNLAPGTYTIGLDPTTGWAQTTPPAGAFTVTVVAGQVVGALDFGSRFGTPTNRPPAFTGTPPTSATVGQLFAYNATATDPDGDPLTFDLVVKPTGMTVVPNTGRVVWVPTADQVGEYDVTLRVQDGREGVALQSFRVAVSPPNTVPVITSTPTGPAVAGFPWRYQVTAQDADGDPITFSLSGPAGMTIDPATGLVSWTPTAAQVGSPHVAITASDNRGGATTQSFDLPTVATAPNDPPAITSTPRFSVRIGDTYLYQVAASDPNGDPLTFSLTTAPAGMSISPAGLVTWVPAAAQLGPNPVTVRVADGRGGFATQGFTVQVTTQTTNRPPNITSNPPGAATVGRLYAYNLAGSDPDGDPIGWSLDTAPAGMSVDAELGTLRWTPTADQLGGQSVVVRADDGRGGWATQSFTITVRAVNLPPGITSTPPTTAAVGQAYAYAVGANDPDGDPLTFSLTTAPTGMTVDAASGLIRWTPTSGQTGSRAVTVHVEDGQGGFADQSFTVVVSATATNHYPVITSTPPYSATAGQPYSYAVTATDPDGDTLLFTLIDGPSGMTIDPTTGVVSWTPTLAQVGLQSVTVAAIDPFGAGGTQTYSIGVSDGNQSPTITSSPVQVVTAGLPYRYDVQASDPDGDPLTFTLDQAPAGMSVDAFGRITWSPGIPDVGTHRVAVTAEDPHGAFVTQTYDMVVRADQQTPRVNLFISSNPALIGTPVTFVVTATDNVGVTGRGLTINGTPVALNAAGQVTLVAQPAGDYAIVASASDAAGNTGLASTTLSVIDPSDAVPPEVDITAPADGAVISAPVDVVGTATDANLISYVLEIAPSDGGPFTEFARGTTPVSNGVLGKFDPTGLANDSYVLRLTATDTGGNVSQVQQTIQVAGDLKVGNFTLSFTDLSVPVSGIPITLARTYDTLQAARQDDFGYGWRMEFRDTDLRTSVEPTGQEEYGVYNPFRDGSRVYVTLPGGRREGFTFRPQRQGGFGGLFFYQAAFAADLGVTDRLSVPDSVSLVYSNGGYYSLNDLAYNPADALNFAGKYTLTTKDGVAYTIDAVTGDLQTVTDAHANSLTFTDTAIVSSEGPRVTFTRDPQGRITAVTDPAGNTVRYQYDLAGDLVAVTDRDGNTTRFVYDQPGRPHYLTEVIDPLGRTGVRTEYDDQGRLVTLIDAAGNPVRLAHDPDNSVETVTDALGHGTTFEYDARGNVVTEVDAEGGITRRTYDGNNNMLTETDPLGRTRSFTYDTDGNVLTETDPGGNVTRNTYTTITPGLFASIRGARPIALLASTTDPQGNTTTNSYDGAGNLLSTSDAAGNVTRYTYDSNGNQTSITDPAGHVTSFAYDPRGNLTRQVDALGNATDYTYDADGNQLTQTTTQTTPSGVRTLVTSTTYDAAGRPLTVTDAGGNTTRTEYDDLGRQSATVDALGRRTEFAYDDRGQLVRTTFADGTFTAASYDAAGHRVSSTDRAGLVTNYVYDALGRLTDTIEPDATPGDMSDNPRTRTEYDAAGEVTAQVDEDGNRTEFGYDAAGRQILVRDALGDETRTAYDTAGRTASTTDALGHHTQFTYDALGRQLRTTFADGTHTDTAYDALGRVASQTDQLGRVTRYEYDALGRLAAVVDALNQRTAYGYDEAGNLTTQTDANGHVTRYEYDGLGRRTATVLPMGQRSETDYDAAGNVSDATNFNGDTILYEYDANNRLAAKHLPDGSSVYFTYTADGQRETVTDARGVTRFGYDERNRLVSRTDPDGTAIAYTYDAAGNRTSVTTPAGTTGYTFDALNRTATVTDPEGGLTEYSYDAAGNLTHTDLPNGTSETRQYDSLNRLVFLENAGPGGVIDSFRYTLAATGRRDAVTEDTGRRVVYGYDALDRLTGESITDAVAGNRTFGYTYDPVGNRLTRTDTVGGTTAYTYDANDRLLTETTGGAVTAYTYDANGNTLTRDAGPADHAAYAWDAENRLVAATVTDATGTHAITNKYDADGIRVSQKVGGAETRYLIDTVQAYPQVLLEYRPGGLVVVSYVYGNDLISQTRAVGGQSFYHVDGLGSTRALTDMLGVVTDRYVYEAFGRTIGQTGSTANSYLFAGEQRDAGLGLDYLRARYLNVGAGRFNARDSFAGMLQSPKSLNHYSYANDNPVMGTDPSGHVTLGELVATVTIIDILATTTLGILNRGHSWRDSTPDAVAYGISVSGNLGATGLAILTSAALTAGLAPPSVFGPVISGLESVWTPGGGGTVGFEVVADARSKEVAGFAYAGPIATVSPGLGSPSVSVYQSIIYKLDDLDEYKRGKTWFAGVTVPLGGPLGLSVSGFRGGNGTDYYGYSVGVTRPSTPGVFGGLLTTVGPIMPRSGLEAVRPWLTFAWPPNGFLLTLKAYW